MSRSLNDFTHQLYAIDDHCIIVSRLIQDIEELSQAFEGIGCSIIQLSAGSCHGRIFAIQMMGLNLFRVTVNCSVYTLGSKSADGIIFSTVLTAPVGNIISHKTALPQQALFGFDSTRELNLITPEQIDLAVIVVSGAQFQKTLQDLDREDLDPHFFKRNYIQPTEEAQRALQAYLQQTFHLASTNPRLLQRSQKLLKGDLLPLLINCLHTEVSPRLRIHPFRRSVIVQQAEDFIMAHLDQPLTLQDLCKSVTASKSALSYGFQEIFGMSPMAYLKIRRLNGVHHALKQSNLKTDTVLSVANRYGFWHMGHFSQDYKQMFGELPSKTLGDF